MSATVQIKFSGGGNFRAQLLESEAPETCASFWEALPFEGKILHGSFTGLTLFFFVEFAVAKVENPYVTGARPGCLLLNTYANKGLFEGKTLHEEIILPYSTTGIFWNWGGMLPSNHFAQIQDSLDKLYTVGRRLKEHGAEIISLSKL